MSETAAAEAPATEAQKPETEAAPIAWAPASKEQAIAFVQALIEMRFVRYDMVHGHLSPEDGARALAALQEQLLAIE